MNIEKRQELAAALDAIVHELREPEAPSPSEAEGEPAIRPTEEAANAFWTYWNRNGVPHVHGYYESTWGAINAALRTSGVVRHKYGSTLQEMLASGKPPKSALNPRAAWPFPDRSEEKGDA